MRKKAKHAVVDPMRAVLRYLRRVADLPGSADLTDGKLLERFAWHGEEVAFEALVQRHGPMVYGVCRRALIDLHDVEDAFQATFLVLVRKAGSIAKADSVGSWLYGVAVRTAARVKAELASRKMHERQAIVVSAPQAETDLLWRDLRPVLDEELHRLPEKYRLPVVLCYLEGKTYEEAAQQTGWSKGTVSTRLTRARELLRDRLGRRGISLSGALLASLWTRDAVSAGVSAGLISGTIQAGTLLAGGQVVVGGAVSARVAALTEGVLKTMFWSQCKLASALLLAIGMVAIGAGILTYSAPAKEPPGGEKKNATGAETKSRDRRGPVETWGVRAALQPKAGTVYSVAISPDGTTLVAGCGTQEKDPMTGGSRQIGTVKLWDLPGGQERASLKANLKLPDSTDGPMSVVESVAFSRDGKLLLATTTTNRQAVILWDMASYQQLPPIESYVLDSHMAVFALDSKTLAGAKYGSFEKICNTTSKE